jgi:hypothetical protein
MGCHPAIAAYCQFSPPSCAGKGGAIRPFRTTAIASGLEKKSQRSERAADYFSSTQ